MDGPDETGDAERISPAQAFSILGNETRIDVLQALWEADGPRAYGELRRDVAPEDSGNFNYHLGKLTDHFVRKADDGYSLRIAGEHVVRAVVAGTITEDRSLQMEEIDERCAFCGGTVEMGYDEEYISVRCTDCGGVSRGDFPAGTYMHYGFPPAGLEGRTREEAVDAGHVLYDSKIAPMMKGVCPECAGRVNVSFFVCENHERDEAGLCPTCDDRFEIWSEYECQHCQYRRRSAVWFAALNHPAVIAFYHERGLEETVPFRKLTWDNGQFVRGIREAVVDEEPYRFRITIPVADSALVVLMDEELDVLDVERR